MLSCSAPIREMPQPDRHIVESSTFVLDLAVDPREVDAPYEDLVRHVSRTVVEDDDCSRAPPVQQPAKRRRVAPLQCQVWLDRLPADARRRVAAHVTAGRQTTAALRLAWVSPPLRLAVLAVLRNQIKLRSKRDLLTWGAFYPETVTDIEAGKKQWIDPAIVPKLSIFPLRRVWLKAQPQLLNQLRTSLKLHALHDVELEVTNLKEHTKRALLAFLRAATAVRKLAINWHDLRQGSLSQAEKRSFARHLANACPHLQALQVFRFGFRNTMQFPWRMLRLLPELREFRIDQLPNNDSLGPLRTMESVRLICAGADAVVHELGPNVTELVTGIVKPESWPKLNACAHLQRLRLCLGEGAEEKLLHVIQAASGIRALELKWSPQQDKSGYRTPTPNLLLTCVRCLPNLNKLELHSVKLPTAELAEILRTLGNRLLHFATSLLGQDDCPLERLRTLMDTVSTCNHAIRSWSFSAGERDSAIVEHTRWGARVFMDKKEQITRLEERKRLLSRLPYLRRRAPYLNTLGLEVHIIHVNLEEGAT